ncbi:MAG: hypothetical protein RL764_1896, partial [Pseudomonadota bacterium]
PRACANGALFRDQWLGVCVEPVFCLAVSQIFGRADLVARDTHYLRHADPDLHAEPTLGIRMTKSLLAGSRTGF